LSSADGRPRRRGPIALLLAWLTALAVGTGVAAYAVVTGPQSRPVDERPQLSMSLPQPPAAGEQAAAAGDAAGGAEAQAGDAETTDAPPADATAGQTADAAAPPTAERAPSSGSEQPSTGQSASDQSASDQSAGEQSPGEPGISDGSVSDGGVSDQANAEGTAADRPASDRSDGGDDSPEPGVAASIPQPPTQGSDQPLNLLAAESARNADQPSAEGDRQAARGEAAETDAAGPPSDATGLPQLPVSDPEAPAWKRYAQRMTPPQGVPKIAVIVRGLGLSSAAAETAVNQLPASVSLAFTPYARDRAQAWAAEARRNGHEVLVDLPMEPANYPATDPGPRAIMTEVSERENLQRLDWLLSQVDREVGAVAQMGSAVLTNPQVAEPVLRELQRRGLMFVDNGVAGESVVREVAQRVGLPFAVNDRTLDGGQVSRRAIEARLVEAERLAREQGLAVVIAHPYPVSLELLVGWTDELETRGFVLVPATYAAIQRAGQNAAQLR
jgi:hypothetical protein